MSRRANLPHGECSHCGERGPLVDQKRGWISSCYHRWYRAGQPDTGPPPPARDRTGKRTEEYVFLRSCGTPPAKALEQVGLKSERSLRAYEKAWKAVA